MSNKQPDLFPDRHGTELITVAEHDFNATLQRLRQIGAVILAFDVKGATYTLNVIMPDGLTITQAMEGKP